MKIGFIGTGNMASAIIKGIVGASVMPCENIFAYDIDSEKLIKTCEGFSINKTSSLNELVEKSDAVVLAIKPNVFPVVLPQIDEVLKQKNPLIISIAAGKTLSYIQELLTYKATIVRVMPNINAKVSAAMSAYCTSENVSKSQKEFIETVFNAVGKIIPLDEAHFPLFGVIAGCSPAYAYMFIDSLARSAVKNGMNKKVALEIAAQSVFGSAKLILESDEHPWELIDQVCSPGGTTIEGVCQLQENGFETAILKAVDAGVNKDKKI